MAAVGFYFINDLSTGPDPSLLFSVLVHYLVIIGLLWAYFLLDGGSETRDAER